MKGGPGEYLFKGLPYSIAETGEIFKYKLLQRKYDYLSFIYSLAYLQWVPPGYPAKLIYELRGWNIKIEKWIESLEHEKQLHGIICIASYLEGLVRQRLKREVPIFVDGNTVHRMFRPLRHPSDVWEDCPQPRSGHHIIAYIGRLEQSKNWRQFLDICAKVAILEPIEIWIVCNRKDTREMQLLVDRVAELGLKDNTRIISEVPNGWMPALYAAVRRSGGLLLSTSLREGLGNHILEPLACDVPVVSTNVPGKNEIIRHRYNGMLYPLEAPGKAVRYVLEVLRSHELRRKLRRGGQRTIHTEFNKVRYVARYKKILASL
ncbi:hypothetical protein PA598K_06805 [Paenibacillus sp. 598K]|uniref:glycosyltransferase n=1 Tax=Paenibacillus sp. 598K TaxID=1117987 RepID=UPI000FFAFEDF|nr:glycosyltransferase [Paenibacillus sp. 598K]GBF78194.1 hypothetical protein PA598K_06805 [Paenibacillus sp. 598K]